MIIMNMCFASGFIQAQAFLYRSLLKCHQILTTSHISCPFDQMSKHLRQQQSILFITLIILLVSTNISMASPLRPGSSHKQSPNGSPSSSASNRRLSLSQSPKWINPCRLPTHPIDPDKDFAGAPPVPVKQLLRNVMSRAKVARNHGQQVKETFLNNTFPDPEFEEGVKTYRQEWLPEIPATSEEVFQDKTIPSSFTEAYEYIQYFAVGLEQILLDQVLHDGKMTQQFKDIEYDLFQLLCEIQLGMHLQAIEPKEDVLRHVMAHQYRDINETSLRNLRDYLILRDYISATNFIAQLFAYLKSNLSVDSTEN